MHSYIYRLLATPYHALRRTLGLNKNEGVYLYFEKLNAVFIALPKNANSTINALIFDKLGVPYDKNDYQSIHDAKRSFSITKKELLELRKEKEIFTFAFVRNPYERLADCWENKINEEEHDIQFHYGLFFKRHMPFADFAQRVCKIPDRFSDIHFRSQYSFLFNDGKPLYDYLGRVETFDDDMKPVTEKLLLAKTVPQMNMSDAKSWKNQYTPKIAEEVYKRYKKDFEMFTYERDTFRAQVENQI